MSEMTIVQLLASHRERELRAQHTPGLSDWLAVPCFCVFAACIMLLVLAMSTVALALEPFRQVAKQGTDEAARRA